MEPLAHTLAGACLAESGLKRATPLATATLLVAANLPDIDGACYLHSADAAFGFRRGLTHGVLAWLLLPLLLTAGVLLFDRLIRRRRHPDHPPAEVAPLVALSFAGVLSHPFLDWLNNHGVRLLMPFSDRWFYGDTLFIVDPWLWLLLGSAVMLAWTTTRRGIVLWTLLGLGTTALVAMNPLVPVWSRTTWIVSLATLVVSRFLIRPALAARLARAGLALALGYIVVMYGGSRLAERQIRAMADARRWHPMRVAAMPVPANLQRRVVIVETPAQYFLVPYNWWRGPRSAGPLTVIEKGARHPAIDAALSLPSLQGTRRWLRFPSYQVDARPDGGFRVIIRDARFSIGTPSGFGVIAVVDLDARLQPVTSSSTP